MVQYSPGTWRDFVWLSAAIAGLNLVLLILFYPESNFHRPHDEPSTQARNSSESDAEKGTTEHIRERETSHGVQHIDHVQVPWTSIWFSFFTVDKTVNIFKTAVKPLAFLAIPNVLWAVFVYGTALSAQIIMM